MINRRKLLLAGGLWLAGLMFTGRGWSADDGDVVEIVMRSSPDGSAVFFDPVGVLVRPGQRVRWVNDGHTVHTATAYHPSNDNHPLRIPAGASPWNSGYLIKPGASFEVRLTVEGVYDYYCIPHERAGMVGRIVVARSRELPAPLMAPYPDTPPEKGWRKVPAAALGTFPPVAEIMARGRIEGHP